MLKLINKKYIVFLVSAFLFVSCFGGNDPDTVENAKKELLGDDYNSSQETNTNSDNTEKDNSSNNNTGYNESYGEEEFVTLNPIGSVDSSTEEVKITGSVDSGVDRIVVKFSNADSSFPDDEFQLTKFEPGDTTFEYNAFKRFQVLDTGVNNYEIIAYKGDESATTEFSIIIPEAEEADENSENNSEIITDIEGDNNTEDEEEEINTSAEGFGDEDDYLAINLPENSNIGNVLKLSTTSFTYSKIEDFEVNKIDEALDLDCEGDKLTDYLIDKYGWIYWNTCRPLNNDINNGQSFFVLRLSGDKYFYEKHYYDKLHNLYGITILETGTGVDKDNIGEKNTEFKAQTWIRQIVGSDEVFNIITK